MVTESHAEVQMPVLCTEVEVLPFPCRLVERRKMFLLGLNLMVISATGFSFLSFGPPKMKVCNACLLIYSPVRFWFLRYVFQCWLFC